MEAVHFWGITFRSAHHQSFFLITVMVFVIQVYPLLLVMLVGLLTKITFSSYCERIFPYTPWKVMAFFHLVTAGIAIFVTKGGQVNGQIYSRDCIWFNALVTLIYWGLYTSTKKVFLKHIQEEAKNEY